MDLTRQGESDSLWCSSCCEKYNPDEVDKIFAWRSMSLQDRAELVARRGKEVLRQEFALSDDDFSIVETFRERQFNPIVSKADVAPDKEALLSLARGLSTPGALREMIDNSLDCAQRKRGGAAIVVSIVLDGEKGFVRVSDDAGGMTRDEMIRCLKLGAQSPDGHSENVIGKFGVGAKEAIYHFGRELLLESCDLRDEEAALEVFVPSRWLDDAKWEIEFRVGRTLPGTTRITIGVLESFDFDFATIRRELSETYSKRINSGRLTLLINDEVLAGALEPERLYPPELYPRGYRFMVSNVMVDVDVAILNNAPEASGIFFYTFGRRYAHWAWTDMLARTIFERPPQHKLNTHFRVDIDFQGRIDDIPINSTKDQVDTGKYVFKPLAKMVARIVQPYLSIISWLSGSNNMGYLSASYAGAEHIHASIRTDSPGFTSRIELGKIYEGMQLTRPRAADPGVLYTAIALERSQSAKDTAETAGASRDAESSHAEDVPTNLQELMPPPRGPTPIPARPPQPTTTFTVSLLTHEPSKVDLFKAEIRKAAESLGLGLSIK